MHFSAGVIEKPENFEGIEMCEMTQFMDVSDRVFAKIEFLEVVAAT